MLENSLGHPPVLDARGLYRSFGSTTALNGIGLQIALGQSLAIMGPSGSGKTTLLHALAGIELPDAGSIMLNLPGRAPVDIQGLKDKARTKLRRESFGFVFQSGLLIPELTAEENVAMALMINGVPRNAAIASAGSALAELGLAGMEQRRIGQLSGGQQQRVAIARAQVTGAMVVFADEPTGALDSATGEAVLELFRDLNKHGHTIALVTHDPDIANETPRRIAIKDGKLTDADLLHH